MWMFYLRIILHLIWENIGSLLVPGAGYPDWEICDFASFCTKYWDIILKQGLTASIHSTLKHVITTSTYITLKQTITASIHTTL